MNKVLVPEEDIVRLQRVAEEVAAELQRGREVNTELMEEAEVLLSLYKIETVEYHEAWTSLKHQVLLAKGEPGLY